MGEVFITGIGPVTPIGIGRSAFTDALRRGTSGTGALTAFDAAAFRCRVSAEISAFPALEFMSARDVRALPRVAQFAVAACRLALEDAQLSINASPHRVGVVVGTSVGPASYVFEQSATFIERGYRRVHPLFPAYAHIGSLSAECAIQIGAKGLSLGIGSACVSSADAIGMAAMLIKCGRADVVIAGGADAPLIPMLFAAFDRLGVMATKFNDCPHSACRPFSSDRDGFVLGEGAVAFVLESEAHAVRRGAQPLAILSGYSGASDNYGHLSQGESTVDAVRAIHEALSESEISVGEIDYVNAHGSGTLQNDRFETKVLREVLGARAATVPVSSTKSSVGHMMGAAPAVGIAATVAGMSDGFFPPTLNLKRTAPECVGLAHVANQSQLGTIRSGLILSFGFGSRCAAVVVKRTL